MKHGNCVGLGRVVGGDAVDGGHVMMRVSASVITKSENRAAL